MAVTSHGIRTPSDPAAYADIIQFFADMAADVDSKFVPRTGATLSGSLSSPNYVATSGGATQGSVVFQTAATNGYVFYDDNLKINGTAGRRLWISGPIGGDVIIKPRSGVFNTVRADATNIELRGAVTITGTLNVTGQGVVKAAITADYVMVPTTSSSPYTWQPIGTSGFTFVAPRSGGVLIGLGALVSTSSGQVGVSYEVRTGAAVGSGTVVLDKRGNPLPPGNEPAGQAVMVNGFSTSTGSNAQYATLYNQYYLSGLTPGATYNVRNFYRNHNSINQRMLRLSYIIQPDV